jgi:hypothetical protein
MMQTIQIVFNKNIKPRQLLLTLQKKRLKRGDKLKIKNADYDITSVMIILAIVIAWYFNNISNKKKNFGDEIEEKILKKTLSSEKMEAQIKKEFDISIESDNEEKDFKLLSKYKLSNAFDDDEPDYSKVMVKEPNPLYKK